MARPDRPLSPHLGVYRWQLHMAMSILHRATGVFLGFGFIVFAWWLLAIASGPDAYGFFVGIASSDIGRTAMLGITFSLIYHALNGIRHLWWDAGRGFELDSVKTSGWLVIVLSIVLTLSVFAMGYKTAGMF